MYIRGRVREIVANVSQIRKSVLDNFMQAQGVFIEKGLLFTVKGPRGPPLSKFPVDTPRP